jgi:hypothetical protein
MNVYDRYALPSRSDPLNILHPHTVGLFVLIIHYTFVSTFTSDQ